MLSLRQFTPARKEGAKLAACVVLPTYNERENIVVLLDRARLERAAR